MVTTSTSGDTKALKSEEAADAEAAEVAAEVGRELRALTGAEGRGTVRDLEAEAVEAEAEAESGDEDTICEAISFTLSKTRWSKDGEAASPLQRSVQASALRLILLILFFKISKRVSINKK